MRSLLSDMDVQEILERIDALPSNAQKQWGTLTLDSMLPHLADSLRVALGRKEAKLNQGPWLFRTPFKYLVIMMPWGKGKAKTIPEMLASPPTEFDADKKKLKALVSDFSETVKKDGKYVSPVFGDLTGEWLATLCWKHLDHHLRQFGG